MILNRCRICCAVDDRAGPGICSWNKPDLCDVCADVPPAVVDAAYAAAMRVKDHGPSFTRDARRYAHAVAAAVVRAMPTAKTRRKVRG